MQISILLGSLALVHGNIETLKGKVVTGYQGWFETPDVGGTYRHWARSTLTRDTLTVDMWPDIGDYNKSELYETTWKLGNGEPAYLFSSQTFSIVDTHFC